MTTKQVDKGTALAIGEAIQLLLNGRFDRLDGDGWKAYKVGQDVIRIDYKVNQDKED